MLQKQVYAFWDICSDHDFKGKLRTAIQIFCATKLEISVYFWNEIIQEVIELLIQKAFFFYLAQCWTGLVVLTVLQNWR